jgi:hypothetical protein
MKFPEEQIKELRLICPGLKEFAESGNTYFYLPDLQLPMGCNPERIDALLCPTSAHGYKSRLFFAHQFSAQQSRNWSTLNQRILERNWSAISWDYPQTNLRLAEILLVQLGAFK